MTPQSHFMVIAPVAAGREAALRATLAGMNVAPGVADPGNGLVPFGSFAQLHFARWVLLDDPCWHDLAAYGAPPTPLPIYLAFIGDCDGPAEPFLEDLVARAESGLRVLYAHCDGYEPGVALLPWLLAHVRPAAACYVNWVGRSVRSVHEGAALERVLASEVSRGVAAAATGAEAQRQWRELKRHVEEERRAGRLTLTPDEPTPFGWLVARWAHAIAVPLVALALLPLLVLLLPVLIVQLRSRERSDPELCLRPAAADVEVLQALEDWDVTNQFTALGPVKPGLFRRGLVAVLLTFLDYACRHIYTAGHLTRVSTIHFASWAFLDGGRRIVFASNYDGSLDGYMDDFINKVGWGLNLVFSNGVGYPRTDWLVVGGSRDEQRFKYFLRRHQRPTQVWYKAYPGITATDAARQQRIRAGIERASLSDAEAMAWLELL